nr:hypothetical protein 31 [bacterium]
MKISTAAFEDLSRIVVSTENSIMASHLRDYFHKSCDILLNSGALKQGESRNEVECSSDHDGKFAAVEFENGKHRYFSPTAGWVDVDVSEIATYKVDNDWLIELFKNTLGIAERIKPIVVAEDIWAIGDAYLGKTKYPVVLVRSLRKEATCQSLKEYLLDKHSKRPALVLTMDKNIPSYFCFPGQSKLVSVHDAKDMNEENFTLDTKYLAEKMGGHIERQGFSEGYRTLHLDGQTYTFSPTKASVLEVMDKAGKPMHQNEIMAKSESTQNRLIDLFKNDPAWKVIFKNDRKGNYWLEY